MYTNAEERRLWSSEADPVFTGGHSTWCVDCAFVNLHIKFGLVCVARRATGVVSITCVQLKLQICASSSCADYARQHHIAVQMLSEDDLVPSSNLKCGSTILAGSTGALRQSCLSCRIDDNLLHSKSS